jgi:hypothetical protein
VALPIVGALAGMAVRAGLGVVGRAVVSRGVAGGASRGFRRLRRRAGTRFRRRKAMGLTLRQATGKVFRNRRQGGGSGRRANQRNLGESSFGRSFRGNDYNYQQPMMQQQGIGFSSAGTGGADPQSAQQAVSQFTNRILTVVPALTAFAGAAAVAVKALHGFGSLLVDSQRGTARYSGSMSGALAGLEVGRIGRDIQSSQNTGGSFVRLTQSLDKLERAMQPFRDLMTNVLNSVTSELMDAVTPLVRYVGQMLPAVSGLGVSVSNLYYWMRAPFNMVEQQRLRQIDEQSDRDRAFLQRKAAVMNFGDFMALRANVAIADGVRRPNPNIKSRPVKGPDVQSPAPPARVVAPVFAPPHMNPGDG